MCPIAARVERDRLPEAASAPSQSQSSIARMLATRDGMRQVRVEFERRSAIGRAVSSAVRGTRL
jgi:hypothetical protein